ncbi:MAG: hypothetical protein LBI03_09960 [Clostridiales bacterium]|nr:hypothetical protein [Clostridiales bacterium]
MGLFDKLKHGLANEILGNINKNQSTVQPPHQNTRSANLVSNNTIAAEYKNAKPYFAQILSSEFNQYQVRENVPVSELGGTGRPYDFGLYQNGKLVSVVVLAEHNRTRNQPYWNSEKKAAESNIPFINFYTHMPNKRDFVIYRINHMMGLI